MDVPTDLRERYNVSRESWEQLATYVELLLKWQQHINLIGPSTRDDIWQRHIADSLQLLPLLGEEPGNVADLGSGGGFPGLVVAIAGQRNVDLYDSNQKKSSFLLEAIRVTKAPARVHTVRLENIGQHLPRVAPKIVTARALAPLATLLEWAAPLLEKDATGYFHKGQDLDSELTEATKYWKMNVIKHPSVTDSRAAILEVRDFVRV